MVFGFPSSFKAELVKDSIKVASPQRRLSEDGSRKLRIDLTVGGCFVIYIIIYHVNLQVTGFYWNLIIRPGKIGKGNN